MAADRIRSGGEEGLTRRQFVGRSLVGAGALATGLSARSWAQAAGSNERLGIGFIGTGSRGNFHLNIVNWLSTQKKAPVDIVAVCDVYRPRMEKAATYYKAKGYMDYRELLADEKVDVVCVATADHNHLPQAMAALRAGKDVYCEKPLSHWRQFELVREFEEVAEETKQVFQLGTQGMSDAAWRQMKALVQKGMIGQPIHAETGFFRVGDWGERGMPIDDANAKPGADLDWEAFLGDSPARDFDVSRFFRWRMYEDYAGGPVTDLYPHSLTPVASILGLTWPSSVVATGGKFRYEEREVPDTFNMLMDYPERLTVSVQGTQGNDYQATGSRGSGTRVPVFRGWEGALTVQGDEIVFIPAEGNKAPGEKFAIEHHEDVSAHWLNFLGCCQKRDRETNSPAGLAVRTQTALIMGMLAYRAGKTARYDQGQRRIVL